MIYNIEEKFKEWFAQQLDITLEAFKVGQENNRWKDELIAVAVVSWSYKKEHEDNPRQCIADIISWEIQVALNPKVSSQAQELINEGIEKAAKLIDEKMGFASSQLAANIRALKEDDQTNHDEFECDL